jgi:hypothetical protein
MAQQNVTQATPKRMTLGAIKGGRLERPPRILLYGTEGVGKSTFGADAPAPIFLAPEDGTSHLAVDRFPEPKTWQDVLDAVEVLTTTKHEFKTLVVDTLDWLEPLCWAHVCQVAKVKAIEDFGYGKGYTAALDEWRHLLSRLETLREKTGMAILLLAHSTIKSFRNPEGDDFERYQLKLSDKSAALLKEWADAVLFASHETFAVKDKSQRVRGISSGARVLHTERSAAFDAKNRWSLPPTLALSWIDLDAARLKRQVAPPAELKAEIAELRASAPAGSVDTGALDKILAAAGDNAEPLARIRDRLRAKQTAPKEGAK